MAGWIVWWSYNEFYLRFFPYLNILFHFAQIYFLGYAFCFPFFFFPFFFQTVAGRLWILIFQQCIYNLVIMEEREKLMVQLFKFHVDSIVSIYVYIQESVSYISLLLSLITNYISLVVLRLYHDFSIFDNGISESGNTIYSI